MEKAEPVPAVKFVEGRDGSVVLLFKERPMLRPSTPVLGYAYSLKVGDAVGISDEMSRFVAEHDRRSRR